MGTDMVATYQKMTPIDNQSPDYIPVRMLEVELGQPLPTISAFNEKTGQHYQRALCLIRLHTRPLGIIELQLDEQGLSAGAYAERIWHALHTPIVKHLQEDGLPAVTGLDAAGVPSLLTPKCIAERESFLQTAPFVSVIVSTHDRPERLSICLHSLLSQHYPRYEIIVVDNAPSTNATADLIRQTYGGIPELHYIREDRPGLSWGQNCGMTVARGEIFAFTDDDGVVDSYWLLELVKAFSIADDVACVTGLVLPLELETPAQILLEEYGGFSKGFMRRVYDMAENRAKQPLYPYTAGRFGTGAGMAFRSAFLRSVGGFDPALRCGMDIAAFFQVVTQGYKLVYEPAAIVHHLHHRDYAILRKQIYNYGVGLTAYLTKVILENPLLLFDILAKVPYGLFFILSFRSPKNSRKSKNYPQELNALERKGMFYGPFAYVRSRWEMCKLARRTLALKETCAVMPVRRDN